eukprot:jgi/Orpsp1_1/1184751/evm.model.c7180000090862.1
MKCFPNIKKLFKSSNKKKYNNNKKKQIKEKTNVETSVKSISIDDNNTKIVTRPKLTLSYINNNENPEIKATTFFKSYLEIIKEKQDDPFFSFYNYGSNDEPARFTANQYDEKVNCVITALYTTFGLKKSDVVAVYLPNCLPYIIIEGAAETSGLIWYPLNYAYSADQLGRLIKKGHPSLVVTNSTLLPNVRKSYPELNVLLVDVPSSDIENRIYAYGDILKTEPDLKLIDDIRSQIQPNDVMYYGCTSGSTGDPKICVYTNRQYTGNIMSMFKHIHDTPGEERIVGFIPFFTTSGHISLGYMLLGGVYFAFINKFDPEKIFEIIEREEISDISGPPSAYLALIHHPSRPKYNLSTINKAMIGGAAASNEFLEKVSSELGFMYCASCFGMTEGCGIIYRTPCKSSSYIPGPVEHFEFRIVDRETREVVNIGYPGELEYRSEIMMKEYLDNPEANREAFTEDRWFKTGDEAVMDEDGYLTITGRIKEMILRGGHNIWPNEIVDILNNHPKIQESAVIGIPDKFQGEAVVAFVIVKPGCQFDYLEKELRDYLKDKLVPFSIPTYYFAVSELPRNSSRKVYAPKLKEMVPSLIQERFKQLEENNHDKPITEKGKEIAQLWSEWFDVPVNTISRSTNFFDMGGDSLVGVKTTGMIKKYYENIPFNFLNTHQTLGEIEDFLKDPEHDRNSEVDKQLVHDYEQLKTKSAQELFGEINRTQNRDRKCVAVTGAAGYLGVYIVNELSKRKDIKKIYCIGRSSNQGELKVKMLSTMKKVGLEINDKIELVLGDVTKPDCGIESSILEKIKSECTTLIHCAAVVNWSKTYGQLKECNVDGVINAMKIAGKAMDFVYISSFGAALNRNETLSDEIPTKTFAYIQTKWLAEHYVEKGKEIGIHSTIIRPCYIIADSKIGICNTDDFIYKFIRQCVLANIAPSEVLLNLTPVDKVAKGVVDFMNARAIINLIPDKQTSTDELFMTYNEKYNKSVELIEKNQWMSEFVEKSKNNEEALSIIPSLVAIHNNISITSDYLKNKNNFLNFEKSDILVNFNKLHESGFFNTTQCKKLIGRSK